MAFNSFAPCCQNARGLIFGLYVRHATVLLLFGPLLNRTVCDCVNLGSLNVDSVTARETMRQLNPCSGKQTRALDSDKLTLTVPFFLLLSFSEFSFFIFPR